MVHLRTLGELRLDGSPTPGLSSRRKELVLLVYLARRAPRSLARTEAAALLWPHTDERRARQSLRQALLELRQVVGEGLVVDTEVVHLTPGTVELDITMFEREVDEGTPAAAVARWNGEFLSGAEDVLGEELRGWLEAERERLRRRLAQAFGRLVDEAQRNGEWERATEWAERWSATLPLDLQAHLQLLRLLQRRGRSSDALARFAALRSHLGSLDLEPSAELQQLATQLERDSDPRRQRAPYSAVLLTPDMIGRGAAIAELDAAWQRVCEGDGAAVVVEGEQGVGKTRLCQELLRRIQRGADPHVVVQVRPRESGVSSESSLLLELAASLAAAPGLAGTPPSSLAVLAAVAPAVSARFSSVARVSASQEELPGAIREALTAVAEESPTALFVDNLGQADASSRALALSLMEGPPPGLLLLAAVRSGDGEPVVMLPPAPSIRRLKLQPLSLEETDLLLGSMLELPAGDRQELAAQLHQHGSGNPFFTVELISALADDGTLTAGERGTWRLGRQGAGLPLPSSVRDVIARRLERLSPPAKAAIEAAAVLAFPFDRALLVEVARQSPVVIEAGLNELLLQRLIRDSGGGGRYEFASELVRSHVERTVPVHRSELLSSRISSALERRSADDPEHQAVLAHHRARAARVTSARRRRSAAIIGAVMLGLIGIALATRPREPSLGSISRVLWVDDSPDGNAGVLQQLSNLGVRVTSALNTEEGVARYDPAVHQLVISDMGRFEGPNESYVERAGLTLLERLRARQADVRLIFCTSERANARFREEALAAGALAVVTDCRDIVRFIGF